MRLIEGHDEGERQSAQSVLAARLAGQAYPTYAPTTSGRQLHAQKRGADRYRLGQGMGSGVFVPGQGHSLWGNVWA